MFGYVKPYKPEMKVKEYEQYKAYYCGLCKALGNEYGIFSRVILSYDCTFFAIADISLKNKCSGYKTGKCTFNPMKKCTFADVGDNAYSRAAALSVVTTYYKIVDNIEDSRFLKRLLYRLLKLPASRWRKKAIKKHPQIEEIVKRMSQRQAEVEKDKDASIDAAAEPTALMLQSVMCILAENEKDETIFGQFGYHLGKWIYLMDACDDMEKDEKNDNFNPFVSQLIKKRGMDINEIRKYQNGLLNQSVAMCTAAYNLIDFKKNTEVLNNVVNLGLAEMQRQVLFNNKREPTGGANGDSIDNVVDKAKSSAEQENKSKETGAFQRS